MAVPVSMMVTVAMRVVMSMVVCVVRRVGVQVATHGSEVESFRRNVNSSVIA
jgi:hypothetical protein